MGVNAAQVLPVIRGLGAACRFACMGDVLLAMGGRLLSQLDVNKALAAAASCAVCPAGWRVHSVDVYGDLIIIEVRIDPPVVLSLGP